MIQLNRKIKHQLYFIYLFLFDLVEILLKVNKYISRSVFHMMEFEPCRVKYVEEHFLSSCLCGK